MLLFSVYLVLSVALVLPLAASSSSYSGTAVAGKRSSPLLPFHLITRAILPRIKHTLSKAHERQMLIDSFLAAFLANAPSPLMPVVADGDGAAGTLRRWKLVCRQNPPSPAVDPSRFKNVEDWDRWAQVKATQVATQYEVSGAVSRCFVVRIMFVLPLWSAFCSPPQMISRPWPLLLRPRYISLNASIWPSPLQPILPCQTACNRHKHIH
jgi:hypothetical protein